MAGVERLICGSGELVNSGKAVRFEIEYLGARAPAFAVRFEGRVYAYLNRCGHMPMELDWREGEVFDSEGRDLICSTHGSTFAAASGKCLGGPSGDTPLVPLRVEERDGNVYYLGIEDG
ncbi:MAG: Rieske (2Fe-2S) protein [Burkholderiales bacterium]